MSRATLPGVPQDWASECTRLQQAIRQARVALEDGRRGDALKILRLALPSETPGPGAPLGGGRAA